MDISPSAKGVKSSPIVYPRDGAPVGIGASR
jgi:hypothetical protein